MGVDIDIRLVVDSGREIKLAMDRDYPFFWMLGCDKWKNGWDARVGSTKVEGWHEATLESMCVSLPMLLCPDETEEYSKLFDGLYADFPTARLKWRFNY